jgi:NAD(P)H-dependent flavin oxidoreductase YrpB (nitropropane dioxygenase family)
MEATKSSKPSMERVASGDSASRQAVTCVNAEQASKDQDAGADLAVFQGRPPSRGELNDIIT